MSDKPCAPENMVALLRAKGQTTGDIFSEAERVKDYNGSQRFYYERYMAKHYGIDPKQKKQASSWDAYKPDKKPIYDGSNYDRPSQMFSKKFYGAIDRKMELYNKSGGGREKYSDIVAKPVRTLIKAIREESMAAQGNRRKLHKNLAKFGLNHKTVYHGLEYLEWIQKGGHTQQAQEYIGSLNKVGSNIAKAQANFQLAWTMGNGVDMIRIYSHYLTRKPSSLANVIKGTAMAMKATGGNPARRIKELEKAGIYESRYAERGGKNISPFEWSTTAQKNLAYYLDKASGGDGRTGIRDLVFDSKAWDRPAWDREANAKLIFDLARYPINEARYLYKTGEAAFKGDSREIANLLVYGLAKSFAVGSRSLVPAAVYLGLNEDQKEWLKDFDEKLPAADLIRKVSRGVFTAMGATGLELDLAEYTMPGGGSLGARLSSIKGTADKVGKGAVKGVSDLSKGNIPAAAARAGQSLSALANIGYGKWAELPAKLLGPANTTQTTDLMDTLAKKLEGEFPRGATLQGEVAKDLLGQRNIKKAQ